MKNKTNKTIFLILSFVILFAFSLILTGCMGNVDAVEKSNSVQEKTQQGSQQEDPKETQQEVQEKLICPKGLDDEPSPGSCPLYRDENKDGFCDFE